MRRRLGNIFNVLSLLLCAATILLWKTEPQWLAIGWAGRHEVELHAADAYLELTLAHHMTLNRRAHRNPDEFFTFYQHSSGWGNPIMRQWHNGVSHIYSVGRLGSFAWFGHGSDQPDATGIAPAAQWLAIDARLLCAATLLWPALWVLLRQRRRS